MIVEPPITIDVETGGKLMVVNEDKVEGGITRVQGG